MNKTERYKKLRTDTIKKSRATINKKTWGTNIKRFNNKARTFHFESKYAKNTKNQTNIQNMQKPFENVFDYQHSEFPPI